ncbi:hypothetical protein IFU20_12935 [Pseudomonas viridiflava]|uniref:hypothetical protein n=1 Tax=Pseudomonas viridiflava TaxID=33069 RepID=UPI0017872D59|nr:hypothetical protein [Pseudomonas viridiflava]MBD8187090.1 hypothetical protein [Pseudomonas viridiflava]
MSDAFVCQRLTAFGTAQGCDPANLKKARPDEYFFDLLDRGFTPSEWEVNQLAGRIATRLHRSSKFLSFRFQFHELYYSQTLHLRVFTHKWLKFLTLIRATADIHKVVATNCRLKSRRFDNLLATLQQTP